MLTSAIKERATERGLDEPALALQFAAGLGVLTLSALAWGFWDYGAGLLTSFVIVNDAPTARLAAMQPANEYRVDTYGLLLDLLLMLYGVVCLRILTWAKRSAAPLTRMAKVAALVVPAIALTLWQLPYRLMYQSAFERVDLETTRCYSIGANERDLLLHCPDTQAPRNRIVSKDDPRLHPRGVFESMFSPYQVSHPTQ
jgi:hypothetical protein